MLEVQLRVVENGIKKSEYSANYLVTSPFSASPPRLQILRDHLFFYWLTHTLICCTAHGICTHLACSLSTFQVTCVTAGNWRCWMNVFRFVSTLGHVLDMTLLFSPF